MDVLNSRAETFLGISYTVITSRRDEVVTPSDLATVLPRADVVVLASPATAEARGLVDDAFLARLRPGSILVNTSRGDVVDEAVGVEAGDDLLGVTPRVGLGIRPRRAWPDRRLACKAARLRVPCRPFHPFIRIKG